MGAAKERTENDNRRPSGAVRAVHFSYLRGKVCAGEGPAHPALLRIASGEPAEGIWQPALQGRVPYVVYTYAVTSAHRDNSANHGFFHIQPHPLPPAFFFDFLMCPRSLWQHLDDAFSRVVEALFLRVT